MIDDGDLSKAQDFCTYARRASGSTERCREEVCSIEAVCFWSHGNPVPRPRLAIIGSRKASGKGLDVASEIAKTLVKNRVVIVSGLAEGIDTAAHRAAIESGGRTIAVLGTPLDRVYPQKNSDL